MNGTDLGLASPEADGRSAEEDGEEDNYDDWISEADERIASLCLFCSKQEEKVEKIILHMKTQHAFDLVKTIGKLQLDTYSSIQFLNYLRSQHTKPQDIPGLSPELWKDETFLQPVVADDALIQYVVSLEDQEDDISTASQNGRPARAGQAQVELIEELRAKVAVEASSKSFSSERDDSSYFASYGYLDIHETMLKDVQRTEAYRRFIEAPENAPLFKGKTVLDVGCGTGILSMFAARAGAASVVGVDESSIVEIARKNVEENGLHKSIRIIQGRIEEVILPEKSFDIIISEWMGYNLLYESMLDSVLFAISKFLVPSGIVVPSQCDMMLTVIHDEELWRSKKDYWTDVYGFRMTAVQRLITKDALIDFTTPDHILARPTLLQHFHLSSMNGRTYIPFTTNFELQIEKDSTVHAFVTYFDARFQADGKVTPPLKELSETTWKDPRAVVLSTAPSVQRGTHWKQTIFVLDQAEIVEKGQKVHGKVITMRHPEGRRLLMVEIHWHVGNGPLRFQVFTIE